MAQGQRASIKGLNLYLGSPGDFQGFFNSLTQAKQFKLEADAGFPRYESNYDALLEKRKDELGLVPEAPTWLATYLGLKDNIGIGKPSLRLEFANNQELLEWSKLHQIDTIKPASKFGITFQPTLKDEQQSKPKEETVFEEKPEALELEETENTVELVENNPNLTTSQRLEILKNSLIKKEERQQYLLSQFYGGWHGRQGQPIDLSRKSDRALLNRTDKYDNALRNISAEIQKTKDAIEREEGKLRQVELTNQILPASLLEFVNRGELIQWRKYPNTFFIPGIEKVRLIWKPKENKLFTRYGEYLQKSQKQEFVNLVQRILDAIDNEQKTKEGIGKPSLRLEFESNQELLEWSKIHQIDTIKPASKSGKAFKASIKVDEPREPEPIHEPDSLVRWVPLKEIHEAKQLFQNRQDDYSKESVKRILKAVEAGTFRWESLDPITLWVNPVDGLLYILSGHSRTQAFRELAKLKKKVDGKPFTSIPAKISRVSLAEAKEIALNSNTLSTKESDLERANYYRAKRFSGIGRKELEAEVRDKEGKNAVYILNLSYLNPNGSTILGLQQMQEAEDVTNKQIIQTIADWIGEARRKFEDLNNSHEEEIYNWLFGGAYGTGPSKLSSKVAFMQRITDLMQRRLMEPKDAPLNIENRIVKNPLQADYDKELEAAEAEVKAAERTVAEKRRYLVEGGATTQAIERALEIPELELQAAIRRLGQLKADKGKVREAVRSQPSLFGLEPAKYVSFTGKHYNSLYQFILDGKEGLLDKTDYLIIGAVPKLFGEEILKETGIDCRDFSINLCATDAVHIFKHFTSSDSHPWEKEEFDSLPMYIKQLRLNDFKKVGQEIHFSSKINNSSIGFIIAFINSKKKARVRLITAYKIK
ncbi:MAG: hypothetical protein EBX41_05120 [Chitinophagia bacterium]|nr:hypothetical protein [Chitinophagia bacterium]